jgi:RNA polymerase sigma-70 factor (ECF subfamily)
MTNTDLLAQAFEEHRDHLRAVAYRLLGSASDADDAVQDAWLRLTSTDASTVENIGAWLTTVVARVSLNMLRSRRRRREEPVGDRWPAAAEAVARAAAGSPVAGSGAGAAHTGNPENEAVLADSVGLALLVVLDRLTPAERLAFVLHDVFAMSFAEVGSVLGRSPEAARQLASRARRRVRGTPDAEHGDLTRQREVATAFLAATRGGDMAALLGLLDAEVALTADGAAAPAGRPVTLQGIDVVSRGAVASSPRAEHSQLALIDGSVGIVYAPGGRLQLVLAFTLNRAGKISGIDVIADPVRLDQLELAVLPD